MKNLHLGIHLLDGAVELDLIAAKRTGILDHLNRVREIIEGSGGREG